MRFVKKPVEIEAIQFVDADSAQEILEWVDRESSFLVAIEYVDSMPYAILIETLEGSMKASKDDWIIRGVKGEFYPCKPDIFNETYTEVAAQ